MNPQTEETKKLDRDVLFGNLKQAEEQGFKVDPAFMAILTKDYWDEFYKSQSRENLVKYVSELVAHIVQNKAISILSTGNSKPMRVSDELFKLGFRSAPCYEVTADTVHAGWRIVDRLLDHLDLFVEIGVFKDGSGMFTPTVAFFELDTKTDIMTSFMESTPPDEYGFLSTTIAALGEIEVSDRILLLGVVITTDEPDTDE